MTETIKLTAGEFSVDTEARSVRGLLVPWGETSRPNVSGNGPVMFERGSIRVPADISALNANRHHHRYDPIGRFTAVEGTEVGLVADFAISRNPEGDEFLADFAAGKLTKLSAEVYPLTVKDGKGTATLVGAAFVGDGAFASAGLFELAPEAVASIDALVRVTAPEGTTEEQIVETIAAMSADLDTLNPDTSDSDPEPVTKSPADFKHKEADVTVATVPNGLTEARAANTTNRGASISDVSAALAMFGRNGDRTGIDALDKSEQPQGEFGMFALNDVKLTTAGSVGVNILQPQWIGELWRGREFERRIIPLIGSANLTSFKVKGFRWLVEPVMAAWAGDKANVPSNTPTTEGYELTASRYAGGHDIAREYRDFDVPEFWEAYFRAMVNSYAKLTDDAALTALLAGAVAVTAGAVPANTNAGMVTIVDGALAVLPTGTPTFAVVAPDVFRSIMLTRETDKLAFLNAALGLEDGTIGAFRVVPHPGIAVGKALVGVSAAATQYELPGSPIRTEALDQIKGGIDEALFGYAATGINRPAGLALVTPAV